MTNALAVGSVVGTLIVGLVLLGIGAELLVREASKAVVVPHATTALG